MRFARGVTHVLDDVVDVVQDERGWISYVTTATGATSPVICFVDCTASPACC